MQAETAQPLSSGRITYHPTSLQPQGGCLGQCCLIGEANVLLTHQMTSKDQVREGEGVTQRWGTSLASAALESSLPTAHRLAVHCVFSLSHLTGPKKYYKRNSVLSDIKSMRYIFAGHAILFDKTAINHNQKNRSKGRCFYIPEDRSVDGSV